MASDSISKHLGDSAEVRLIADRLEQIKRLQKRFRTIAPENLAAASRVCAIDGTTVVVCAASGSIAAALRHLAPRLLAGLQGAQSRKHPRDQELNSIRIEVQVEAPEPRRPVRPRSELPVDKLARLSARLADSPLKDELERIARDQARRTRSKT